MSESIAAIDAAIAKLQEAKAFINSEAVRPVYVEPSSNRPAPPAKIALPKDNASALTAFYGAPSSSPPWLDWFSFPHPETRLYSRSGSLLKSYIGDSRLDHRTHKMVSSRLENALAEIFATLGQAQFEKEGWHVYGGSHNYRPTTSGGRLSTHAWACAIDMNPNENEFAKTTTTFSDKAIDTMEKWGFLSGGRAWGKDWMHFQAAIPGISSGSYYARNGLPKNITEA